MTGSGTLAGGTALLLVLAAGCGPEERPVPGGGRGADAGPTEGEGEGPDAAVDPDCELGQVERDGRCYDRCGTNGPICEDDEVCVLFEGERGCKPRCGVLLGGCGLDLLCYVPVDRMQDPLGFCAAGDCPDGSHKGADGWCVCDTGELPPEGVACRVELCGPGNRSEGRCPDPNQICVDGECKG